MTTPEAALPSVDTRSRAVNATGPESVDAFLAGAWADAMAVHGERAVVSETTAVAVSIEACLLVCWP